MKPTRFKTGDGREVINLGAVFENENEQANLTALSANGIADPEAAARAVRTYWIRRMVAETTPELLK